VKHTNLQQISNCRYMRLDLRMKELIQMQYEMDQLATVKLDKCLNSGNQGGNFSISAGATGADRP